MEEVLRSWKRGTSVRVAMPVPLAPYPTATAPFTPPANGAQSQLVCSGCRNLLLYPVGATSVCCAVCNAVTAVPPRGARKWLSWFVEAVTPYSCTFVERLVYNARVVILKSGGTCQLWELSDAVNVPIWSTVCEMCSLQFCDISWAPQQALLNKSSTAKIVQQLSWLLVTTKTISVSELTESPQ
ncbi:unnamed protein product [Camellia sinensis]